MNRQDINTIFDGFNQLKALVIGDVMIDSYLWGNVTRISPEAPVPVVSVLRKESRLGGAANVALNLKALGATPIICSIIGTDPNGRHFLNLLQQENLSSTGIICNKNRITSVKTRVIGNRQQMLRVDEEEIVSLTNSQTEALILKIEEIVKKEQIHVIIFEDYDKGIISSDLIRKVSRMAKEQGVLTTADPKKNNFVHYKNIDLFKPNLKELTEGINHTINPVNINSLKEATLKLNQLLNPKSVMITLSENGIYISTLGQGEIIPAHIRNVSDVSGAGDTVISVASLCLALKLSLPEIALLSNIAGGLVCEEVGVIPVKKEVFKEEVLKIVQGQN